MWPMGDFDPMVRHIMTEIYFRIGMDVSLDDTGNDDEYEQLTAAQVLER